MILDPFIPLLYCEGLLPSAGTFGSVPEVDIFFGLPRSIRTGGVEMDLDNISTFSKARNNNLLRKINFVQQSGLISSALEYSIPEKMFSSFLGGIQGISAVKAIAIANLEGQPIYHLTQNNINSIIPLLNHSAFIIAEIRSAVNNGMEVIVHQDPVSVTGWSGTGYIIFDPATGAGAYKISNGANGSFIAVGQVLGVMLVVALNLVLLLLASGNYAAAETALIALAILAVAIIDIAILYDSIWGPGARACLVDGLFSGMRAATVLVGTFTAFLPSMPKKIIFLGLAANYVIGELFANVLKPPGVACSG